MASPMDADAAVVERRPPRRAGTRTLSDLVSRIGRAAGRLGDGPAGAPTEDTIVRLGNGCKRDDVINRWRHTRSIRTISPRGRAAQKGVHYLDVGTSGGIFRSRARLLPDDRGRSRGGGAASIRSSRRSRPAMTPVGRTPGTAMDGDGRAERGMRIAAARRRAISFKMIHNGIGIRHDCRPMRGFSTSCTATSKASNPPDGVTNFDSPKSPSCATASVLVSSWPARSHGRGAGRECDASVEFFRRGAGFGEGPLGRERRRSKNRAAECSGRALYARLPLPQKQPFAERRALGHAVQVRRPMLEAGRPNRGLSRFIPAPRAGAPTTA